MLIDNSKARKDTNMIKRSRTNIQVSSNHSQKRQRQYGGAAYYPGPTATEEVKRSKISKQIFKGDAIQRLNEYLDLDLDTARGADGSYKFKFKNVEISKIQSKLDVKIKALQNAITTLGNKLNLNNIAGILNFGLGLETLLDTTKFEKINLKLKYLNTRKIIQEIDQKVSDSNIQPNPLTKDLDKSFHESELFREQIKALFDDNADYIPINLLSLKPDAIENGWTKLTNKNATTTSHVSKNEVLAHAQEIDINYSSENAKKINDYFLECEKLQVYYNKKHNEIIDLYDTLRGIITIKLTLVNLILEILKIIMFIK